MTLRAVVRSPATVWAAFILVHLWLGLLNLYSPGLPLGDVTIVYKFWMDQATTAGFWVGIDSVWVYPVVALVPMLIATVFGPDQYGATWLTMIMLLDAVAFGFITGWGRSRERVAVAWWWVAFLLVLGPIALGRIDSVTVPLALVGVTLIATRPRAAAVILAIATWVKVWPAALIGAALIALRDRGRILAAVLVVSGFIIAFALTFGAGLNVFSFITQQTGRGVQVESPIATPWLWLGVVGEPHTRVYYDTQILTYQVEGPGIELAGALMTPVLGVAALAIAALGFRAQRAGAAAGDLFPPLALALVTALIALNKVGSPQFIGWLAVPVVLGLATSAAGHGRSFRVPAVIALAIAALTQVVYPYLYSQLLYLNPAMVVVLTARNILEFVLLGLGGRRRRRRTPPARARRARRHRLAAVGVAVPRPAGAGRPLGRRLRARLDGERVPPAPPRSVPMSLSPARVRLAILALALGGFGIGLTEFVAMGLLPNLAADLLPGVWAVSHEKANAQAGWLVSAYALGVVVGAPTIAALAARFPRKQLLLACVGVFVLGTVASALLPTFGLVLVARFVAALPHGAYFGIAALVAASLMGPGKRGRGVAFVLAGLTIANVVGVPAITFLGQQAGWRVAYLAVAAVFAATFIAVALLVPFQQGDPAATMRRELAVFRRPQVWLTLLLGSLGFGGFFAVYTYIAPVATNITQLDPAMLPWVLAGVGIGMTIGNLAGGRAADHHVMKTLFVCFGVFAVSLAGFALTAHTPVGLFAFSFLVGGAASALSPAIQTRLMDVAGDAQSLAAAINHSALNIGNSLGAYLGGLTIAAGLGYISPTWVGLLLCIPGVGLALVSVALERRTRRREGLEAAGKVALDEDAVFDRTLA